MRLPSLLATATLWAAVGFLAGTTLHEGIHVVQAHAAGHAWDTIRVQTGPEVWANGDVAEVYPGEPNYGVSHQTIYALDYATWFLITGLGFTRNAWNQNQPAGGAPT